MDNTDGAKNKIKKYLGNKFVLTLLIFGVWIVFFDRFNVVDWLKEIAFGKEMKKQREYYQKEIKKIDQQLDELSSNSESLEKFAREQYLFKNDDEDLFIVETADSDK